MDIEAIAANEAATTENPAHNISTSEARPDGMVFAWSHYCIAVDSVK